MYKRFIGALYVMNIVFQAILTLLVPPAFLFFINYLLVSRLSLPPWTYAISISVGFIAGMVSMIKFAIAAAEGLERLEKQNKNGRRNQSENK